MAAGTASLEEALWYHQPLSQWSDEDPAVMVIQHHYFETELGPMMLGYTERGICFLQFGVDTATLHARLMYTYPQGRLIPSTDTSLNGIVESKSRACIAGKPLEDPPLLELFSSPLQKAVWMHLQTIPCGTTQTYTDIARGIVRPKAVRAVASACGQNPIALFIPCHRVVRSDGSIGGYRWGTDRKEHILRAESSYGSSKNHERPLSK